MSIILIGGPPGYEEERSYVFDVIFDEFLGIPYAYKEKIGSKDITIQLTGLLDNGAVHWPDVLFQTSPEQWLTSSSLPGTPLPIWDVAKDLPEVSVISPQLPVIYGKPLSEEHWFQHDGREIRMGLDVAGSVFFMLTRYEEMVISYRDEHNRFPARASLAYKEGFLYRPIVDEYVDVLWTCMKRLWPKLKRKKHQYQVCLSHDVDEPFGVVGKPWYRLFKTIIGDVIKRRDIYQRFVAKTTGDYTKDPFNTFTFIMNASERYGLRSTFFFKAGYSNPHFDANYSLEDPWVQKLMQTIHERGHEIGLHPSYESYNQYEVMCAEYEKLIHSVEQLGISHEQWGSRQHYLRWENPTTWQILDEVGIDYDTTLGFADHVGFRCGTCKKFPVFNLKRRQKLRLQEYPLIAMDTTMLATKYMGLRPEQVIEQVERLGNVCRQYGGDLRLLWHNTSLVKGSERGLYVEVLKRLMEAV